MRCNIILSPILLIPTIDFLPIPIITLTPIILVPDPATSSKAHWSQQWGGLKDRCLSYWYQPNWVSYKYNPALWRLAQALDPCWPGRPWVWSSRPSSPATRGFSPWAALRSISGFFLWISSLNKLALMVIWKSYFNPGKCLTSGKVNTRQSQAFNITQVRCCCWL